MPTQRARRIPWRAPRTGVLGAVLVASLAAGCRAAPLSTSRGHPTAPRAGVPARLDLGAELARRPTWIAPGSAYAREGLREVAWCVTAAEAPGGAAGTGGGGSGDLAKAAQNPIANLISLPVQNNTSFGIGPHDRIQNVMNIQPVVPVNVGRWLLVNRAIAPIVSQPNPASSYEEWDGLGDITLTTFVVPPPKGKVMVGLGPIVQFPTASNSHLGTGRWGLGPSGVVVATLDKWVLGLLVNNVWGLEEGAGGDRQNAFLAQYFINYNLPDGWYLATAPIITANWNAPSDDRWVVPFGGGFGKILKICKQPFNIGLQAYYNAVTPEGGADWSLRLQITALFPKK